MNKAPARSVVLDPAAQRAVDAACETWEGAEVAWLAIEWAVARDEGAGVPLIESGHVRAFVFTRARSIEQPDVRVIYEVEPDRIIIRDAIFAEAKAMNAGRA